MRRNFYIIILTIFASFFFTLSSFAGTLGDVMTMLDDPTAGRSSAYYFAFTTSDTGNGSIAGLPPDGKIKLTFPADFNIGTVSFASSQNNNMTGGIQVLSKTGNTVTLQRDSTGNSVAGSIRLLIGVAMVENPATVQSATVTVETSTDSDILIDSGVSATFSITPGEVDHFSLATIGTQTAGSSFSVSITAQDAEDNVVTSFGGTANLMDLTGSLSTNSTGNFTNGQWTGQVSVSEAIVNNRLSVTSIGKSGDSNNFTVEPAGLDHFDIATITSPQTAGTQFSVTIVALDAYDNQVTSFSGSANLSDETGTLSPAVSGNFSGGSWTGSVQITRSQNDVSITAENSGHTGRSNNFNVNSAALSRFQISNISTKAAGEYFSLKITALDGYNNIVNSFTGTANLSDLSGTLSPTITGSFNAGVWSGSVQITSTYQNDVITAQTNGGAITGNSNTFNITANNVDHFDISTISSPQTAGQEFSVTITAKDAQNNTVTDFSGTANLADLTGTISPTVTANFSSGVWTGNVSMTRTQSNNYIVVSGSGKSSSSNLFNVNPGIVDHFRFETISSPRVAGTSFNVTITAEDAFGNQATQFTDRVNLSDDTGTLSPTTSGNFSAGTWSGSVRITDSENDVRVYASRSGRTGQSNTFNVNAALLDQFSINTISTQAAGEPFSITATALDAYDNIVTDFTSTVELSDETGTISPVVSGNFSQGQWTGTVSISQARTGNTITVRNSGGSESGTSNSFDVISSSIDHFDVSTVSSPQTAGRGFSLTITAKDAQDNTVTGFVGTANLRDQTGTISPVTTTNFVNGVWTGTITITQSGSNSITVTSSGKAGNSNSFTVDPSTLDHFSFSTIESPKTAGSPFSITISARDAYENVVTSFTNPVNLTDATGTISPSQTDAFTGGSWTGDVTLTRSQEDVSITATRNGTTGNSNQFNVRSGQLSQFTINQIETQIAGQPFALVVTAKDNYNNTVTGFTGTVSLSDLTGTISPQVSGAFSQGVWNGNVTVTQVRNQNVISVQHSSGSETGQSNAFDMVSSSVDHFEIATIGSPKTAGNAFQLTITAKDAQNNTVTTFSGTVTIDDETGTITPKTSGAFANGVRTENVTITKAVSNNQITVTAGTKAGESNTFAVNPAALDHFEFATITSPQVASTAFSISLTARDPFDNQVTSFNDKAALTVNKGTISPTQTGAFSNGQWSGDVTLPTPHNDVKISASNNDKTGESNFFNVVAGNLHHFAIDPITTQFAGESFTMTVNARDANDNRVTSFDGTVTISDQTGTITPTTSGNFSNGQWIGSVTISQATESDVITVQRAGGTEKGTSNTFAVTASEVDHYEIANISSPQTVGVPFTIRIIARDADNNLVDNFSGQLKLSDLTGTISPKLTGDFVNGVWEDQVTITQSQNDNIITATNGTRAGSSNTFNVVSKPLDHFLISQIPSPQTAGVPFTITISAVDVYENVVTSFNNRAYLTAPGVTLTPEQTGNFVNGVWTGPVTISERQRDVIILATYNSILGQSNNFNVEPAGLHHLLLRDQPGGFGNEIEDVILTLDDKLRVYAAGYDQFDNYIRDVTVNWSVNGTLEQPQPVTSTYTVLDPTIPGSEGQILGDTTGVISDATGTITVGAISFIKIRTEPGGNGVELGNANLTADDSLALYAAGYDAGGNYLGEVSVFWQSTGDLEPVISDTSTSRVFSPTKAPRSGSILVTHQTATGDQTGTIEVAPGKPVGRIELTPESLTLPADGVSTTTISSLPIYDGDGNIVSANTLFTVRTTIGQIISPPDASAEYEEFQVTPNDSGVLSFVLQASTAGGTAFITVNSTVAGGASGETVVNMTSLKLLSVVTERTTVSRGQVGIPVNVVVENIGSQGITQLNAGLKFLGPAPRFEDRSTDYPVVTRTDRITQIPGGGRQTLSFMVSVGTVALNDTITLDAWVSGYAGTSLVSDSSADLSDKWRVQIPAQFSISRIEAFADTVSQGLGNVSVAMTVKNPGEASALIDQTNLRFWSISENRDLPNDYQVFPSTSNPQVITGLEEARLNFTLNVSSTATLGQVQLNGSISGSDVNSGRLIDDIDADTLDTWQVASASVVGITSLKPSQYTISQSQTQPWYVTMVLKNNATTSVGLDSANVKFLIGGADISDEYVIFTPTYFTGSGNSQLAGGDQDSLRFAIMRTGSTLGLITIDASVFLTDLQTGKSITRSQKTGVTVENPGLMTIKKILPSQSRVTLNQTVPWKVRVVLSNDGGSDLRISPHVDSTFTSFQPEAGFTVQQPFAFQKSGNLILRGGAVDTLVFSVTRSGSILGYANLAVKITGKEQNTQQPVVVNSTEIVRIKVENPAQVRLFSLDSKAPNLSRVNFGQTFKLQVRLQNQAVDASDVKQANVLLTSSGSSVDSLWRTVELVPGGGELRSAFFDVTASAEATVSESFYARITSALSANTGLPLSVQLPVDSLEVVKIEAPARLKIQRVIAPQKIRANQRDWWPIKIVVADSGGAPIKFSKPSVESIKIFVDGEVQRDYIIEPPATLAGGDLILDTNETDTLIYTVTTTGEQSGIADIQVAVTGIDQNSEQELTQSATTSLEVQTSARVVIRETLLRDCYVLPNSGSGRVNRGQFFRVTAVVRNVGREAIEDIYVQLRTNGNSKITETKSIIPYLSGEYGSIDSVYFTIEADSINRLEKFTASIKNAFVQGTRIPATIEASTDSTALVQIMRKAELEPRFQREDSVFTISQVVNLPTIVQNSGEAEVDDSGIITFTAPAHYKIITPADDTTYLAATSAFKVNEALNWRLVTPGYASSGDTIIVSISQLPQDLNVGELASARVRHDTLIVKTLPTKLLISAYEIAAPEGARDRMISTGQKFTVQADLNFSQNLNLPVKVEIKRPEGADYLIDNNGSFLQNVSKPGPVTWTFRAPTTPDDEQVLLELVVTASENRNQITILDSLWVQSVPQAELSLGIWISDPPGEGERVRNLSTGQTFEIKAEVKNKPLAANTYGRGWLEIDPGVTGIQIQEADSSIQSFTIGEAVTWQAIAPETPTTQADLIVRIIESPLDENTDAPAFVSPIAVQDTIPLQTRESGNMQNEILVASPLGAKDSVLSSGQIFQIEAKIEAEGATNIFCELHLPEDRNFVCQQTRKPLPEGSNSIYFEVTAPEDTVNNALFWITSEGQDENNADHPIYSSPDSMKLTVVKKAFINLSAQIVEPAAAQDWIVSVGSVFKVRVTADNLGMANYYSLFEVEIKPPVDYVLLENESSKKDCSAGFAEWWLRTPQEFHQTGRNISFDITQRPLDENTDAEAAYSLPEPIVVVTGEQNVLVSMLPGITPKSVVQGETGVPMLAMVFENVENGDLASNILLRSLKLRFEDKAGSEISNLQNIVSRVTIADFSQRSRVYADAASVAHLQSNPLPLSFSRIDSIHSQKPDTLVVLVDIAENVTIPAFRVGLDSTAWLDLLIEGTTNLRPKVKDAQGNLLKQLSLISEYSVVFEADFKKAFANYPNPFGRNGMEKTTFVYYLEEDTDVSLHIYTLLGELVWHQKFSASDPEGQQGTHDQGNLPPIYWDGRNDLGHAVLNGVYIAVLSTGKGESVTTKTAIIK